MGEGEGEMGEGEEGEVGTNSMRAMQLLEEEEMKKVTTNFSFSLSVLFHCDLAHQ